MKKSRSEDTASVKESDAFFRRGFGKRTGTGIFVSRDAEEIFTAMERSTLRQQLKDAGIGRFPFTKEMLRLLQRGNPLPQRYFFLERQSSFAFFVTYENRMDLLTFGKAHWYMHLQTIACPCSCSSSGYVTNDLPFLLECVRNLKGCKLLLNAEKKIAVKDMSCGETLPTCMLSLRQEHTSIERYIDSLRSPYRRRLHLAMERCRDVRIVYSNDGSRDVHPLYLQTFDRSEYKLERLEKCFFDDVTGQRILFFRGEKPIGFVLLIPDGDTLVFLLCGMDYGQEKEGSKTADIYYLMLLKIVEYAIDHHFTRIDLGQTSEKTKLKFGAELEKRYFYAHHSNPFLNLVAILGRHVLEYKYAFPEYHVFRKCS